MKPLPMPPGQTARAWQAAAADAIRRGWREGLDEMVVQSATGTGKGTLIAALAVASSPVWRCIIITNRQELVDDLADRVRVIGRHASSAATVGIVQGFRKGMAARIVVASVASLSGYLDALRVGELAPFDFIITDECHHATAPSYQAFYAANHRARALTGLDGSGRRTKKPDRVMHIGFTATAFRSKADGSTEGLGAAFSGALVYSHSIVAAIHAGDLVPPVGIKIKTHVSVEGVQIKGADFDEAELQRVIDIDARNELIVQKYIEKGEGRPFLAFAVSVKHAERLAEAFRSAGLAVEAVSGSTKKAKRREVIAAYQSGELQGLVSRDLLFEGFDSPRTSCLIRARSTMSRIIIVQMIGRGLRLHPGKSDCLVIDFVDDGVPVDLNIEADLSVAAKGAGEPRPLMLQPGDMVRLRHGDRGVGTVMSVGDVTCRVMWPARGSAIHGFGELRRATPEEAESVPINLQVVGVTEHAMEIMPGETPQQAIGWYYADSVWSAHAETAEGLVVGLLYRSAKGPWRAWLVQWRADECRAFKAAEGRDLLALRQGLGRLMRSRGGRPIDHTDPRYRKAATDAQKGAMERQRIPFPVGTVSQGEAAQLIARKRAAAAVDSQIREYKRRHARRR